MTNVRTADFGRARQDTVAETADPAAPLLHRIKRANRMRGTASMARPRSSCGRNSHAGIEIALDEAGAVRPREHGWQDPIASRRRCRPTALPAIERRDQSGMRGLRVVTEAAPETPARGSTRSGATSRSKVRRRQFAGGGVEHHHRHRRRPRAACRCWRAAAASSGRRTAR